MSDNELFQEYKRLSLENKEKFVKALIEGADNVIRESKYWDFGSAGAATCPKCGARI